MLLIYYNITHGYYYLKKVSNWCDCDGNYYKVGYTNQFGHIIVQSFVITKNGLKPFKSFDDYLYSINDLDNSLKNRVINRLIGLLNKMKGRK